MTRPMVRKHGWLRTFPWQISTASVILENFAHTLQQVLRNTRVEHVITTQVGDLLPRPKRWAVNLVIKKAKKMVPAWRIDGAIRFRAALARGAAPFKPVEVSHDDIAFLQYTGGTIGVSKGAMKNPARQ